MNSDHSGSTEREWLEGLRYEDKFPDEPERVVRNHCVCGTPLPVDPHWCVSDHVASDEERR